MKISDPDCIDQRQQFVQAAAFRSCVNTSFQAAAPGQTNHAIAKPEQSQPLKQLFRQLIDPTATASIHALISASTHTEHLCPSDRHLGKRPSLMR